MQTLPLQRWRKRHHLTQVEAAQWLGVSQPYLSLLEKGARPLTAALRSRMKVSEGERDGLAEEEAFRGQLCALGYPGFAHVKRGRKNARAESLLIAVLSKADVDARVVEALPWLVQRYGSEMDAGWLTRQAKLRDLQNRLGYVLEVSGVATPEVRAAVRVLERARLLEEATLCWDSMPGATREWMRANRTPLAAHWNVLTRIEAGDFENGE